MKPLIKLNPAWVSWTRNQPLPPKYQAEGGGVCAVGDTWEAASSNWSEKHRQASDSKAHRLMMALMGSGWNCSAINASLQHNAMAAYNMGMSQTALYAPWRLESAFSPWGWPQ